MDKSPDQRAGRMSQDTLVKLTRIRRVIARAMSESATVPQFTVEFEADLSGLVHWRARAKQLGRDVTYTDVLVAACAESLRRHPRMNASFADEGIVEHGSINIGVAVDLPDGLVAPAILDADRRTLDELMMERRRLAAAAKAGTLRPEELLNTTFTISNLGTVGVRRFQALVVPPQAAILAVGAVMPDGHTSLALSCDHRVVDGLPAALFLRNVVDLLENPSWLGDA
jgi:pyruvate dehydrogenase E2 component (dihydrolipoamide acetyltransferase)